MEVEFYPGLMETHFGHKPGNFLENDDFSLTFSEVLLFGYKHIGVSYELDPCYDWTPIMNIILNSLISKKNGFSTNFKD